MTVSTGRSAGAAACSSRPSCSGATTPTTRIEADNNEFSNNVLPRSNPQVYNVTICGDPTGIGSEVQRAANLRRGTAFTIRNFLITGMRQGFQIETTNTATTGQVDNGTSQMGAGVSWNNLNAQGVVTPVRRCTRVLRVHEHRPVPEHRSQLSRPA